MGNELSRLTGNELTRQMQNLRDLQNRNGPNFPGHDYHIPVRNTFRDNNPGNNPSDFDRYLEAEIGEFLIHQEILLNLDKEVPYGVPCYLKGDWTNTDLPETKFESNMQHLSNQPPVTSRNFFYKEENTVTAQANAVTLLLRPLSELRVERLNVRIQPFARLFIMECISRGYGD
ncbi:hypothetical protein H5410_052571 [Solanum commersonii]|uniref:Uncharacterized protein n=1 Tax=Solanum commersonii TaxID=4109 RepID=A0A9J5X4H5_SOLCO|nr:hypothetical protein H5410_052571 [Solanum commersonii]